MRLLLLVALWLSLVVSLRPMLGGRPKGGFLKHKQQNRKAVSAESVVVEMGWIDQILDHFDSKNTVTWQQRFYVNRQFETDSTNVNILYIDGEGTDSAQFIVGLDLPYVYYAEQLNATLYTLEHRFYGDSHPTKDTSIDNLKYLSSRQAVEDLAEFIRQKNLEKGGNQKWIMVGGSYAGSLAAWARLKHPELIVGALASSGPVLAQMDFYGYLQTVDEDFKKIGGLCYQTLSQGIEQARQLLQTPEGRENLTTLFQITPPLSSFDDITDNDRDGFYSFLTYPFEMAAQYSYPPPSQLCKTLTKNGEDYDPLQAIRDINPFVPFDIRFSEGIKELSGTEFDGDISTRLWIYQTCTEFGYFQSTDKGINVFGQTQSSNSFIEYCKQLFGIDVDQIQKNIDATNEYYGGRDYFPGTDVVFSHGTQDPWSFLTKKANPNHWSVTIVEVEGGSHCEDIGYTCVLYPQFCTENMKKIQLLTLANLQRWIDPVFPVPDRVDITDSVGKRPPGDSTFVVAPLAVNANSIQPSADKLRAKRSVEEKKKPADYMRVERNMLNGRRRKDLLSTIPVAVDQVLADTDQSGTAWIQQSYDHFNLNEERTFQQRFYYNHKYGSADGPNFLMIGGEGPENIKWVQDDTAYTWVQQAKEVGANLFLLEHRYYGQSKLGTNDLQYLTSAQMIYDVSTFILTQKVKNNRTGPWITYGGSYAGALSAWSREWFPELIAGAVASSGPVQAKNDFYEYMEVVEDVVRDTSETCYQRTLAAFNSLHVLSQSPAGRTTIQKKFQPYPVWKADDIIDALDMNMLYGALFVIYQVQVQWNTNDDTYVKNLCSYMEAPVFTDPVDALSALRMAVYGNYYILASFDLDLAYLNALKTYVDGHDPTVTDNELSEILWLWQTCNEFGYYQTTDYGDGIFNTPLPLNYFSVLCERLFGADTDYTERGIARTNYQYGGKTRLNTTNVVLPNGNGDPWHKLGITEQGNFDSSIVPVVVPGTSHCADMYAATANDPPELIAARKTVLDNVKKWIIPSAPSPSPVTVPPSFTTTPLPIASSSLSSSASFSPSSSPSSPPSTSTVPPTTSISSPFQFILSSVVLLLSIIL